MYVGFQLNMVAGWNLVGFTGVNENDTPKNMLPAGYTMYYWTAPYGPYESPAGNRPVQLGVGYWVKLNQDHSVTVPL